MHLPNETSVTTLNAVTVNVWLWLEIILNKPRRLVLSANNAEYQQITRLTPNFAPKTVKVGCFYIFLTSRAGQKKGGMVITFPILPPVTHAIFRVSGYFPVSIYPHRLIFLPSHPHI